MQKILFSACALFCFLVSKSQGPFEGDSTLMAFASDTQKPMWVETLFLKSNNNRSATKKIFDEFAQLQPKALFLLGDVVNLGYSNKQWKDMGGYLKTLRSKGIAVHAALGNHEVMGQARKGEEKFQTFFPEHVRTGYVKVVDSVAVILLNSNFGKLTEVENEAQVLWYRQTLKDLDKDPSIEYIITGCHHSPFTNSKIVGCSKDVEQKFVQPFLASSKSRLFLSGHSHNFEQYQVKGKDFLVIGGGGGLHQPLKTGADILSDVASDYKPEFHYLTVKRCAEGLQIRSYELRKDFSSFEEGRNMVILKSAAPNGDYATAGSK
jgi:UDP-2,3-diacylglucosamine pyrophosphatase LpxH